MLDPTQLGARDPDDRAELGLGQIGGDAGVAQLVTDPHQGLSATVPRPIEGSLARGHGWTMT